MIEFVYPEINEHIAVFGGNSDLEQWVATQVSESAVEQKQLLNFAFLLGAVASVVYKVQEQTDIGNRHPLFNCFGEHNLHVFRGHKTPWSALKLLVLLYICNSEDLTSVMSYREMCWNGLLYVTTRIHERRPQAVKTRSSLLWTDSPKQILAFFKTLYEEPDSKHRLLDLITLTFALSIPEDFRSMQASCQNELLHAIRKDASKCLWSTTPESPLLKKAVHYARVWKREAHDNLVGQRPFGSCEYRLSESEIKSVKARAEIDYRKAASEIERRITVDHIVGLMNEYGADWHVVCRSLNSKK